MRRTSTAIALVMLCGAGPRGGDEGRPGAGPPAGPERVEAEGIENLFRLSPGLLSGGQPEGEAGFRALRELGVRTIVTVDGASPDVEAARSLGIRYVHLPIGYDGVPRDRAVALVKAVRSLPGPVFVHCHHGKHRGPAAAALAAMAVEGWGRAKAVSWLEAAGTSPAYAGLFESVERFDPPTPEELAAVRVDDLPERAEVPPLAEAMVHIGERWDALERIAEHGFRVPPGHPDLDPPHEALMLAEHYRELRRLDEAENRGEEFLGALREAEAHALRLRGLLLDPSGGDREALGAAFEAAGRDCTACHARYRDRPS